MANETAEVADSAHKFLARINPPRRVRALRNATVPYEREVWQAMAEAGWLGIIVPDDLGGLGLGLDTLCALAQQIGTHLLPEPFVGAAVQPATLLVNLPATPTRNALLDRLVAGQLIPAVAWQEAPGELELTGTSAPRHSPPQQRASIRSDAGTQRADGSKIAVSPGLADGWIVALQKAGEPCLVWIEANTVGVTLHHSRATDGSSVASLRLDGVVVPPENILASGAAAASALHHANDIARVAQSAELVGAARQALTLALDYMRTRVQFGRPIGSFQALQHQAVDAQLQVDLAAAVLEDACHRLDSTTVDRAALASRVKARCSDAALKVTEFAVHVFGAMGYCDETDVGLYLKRTLALTAQLGNAERHRNRYTRLVRPSLPDWRAPAATQGDFPKDADWEAMPEQDFRLMLRGFLARHYPAHLRNLPHRARLAQVGAWTTTLARQGWLAPSWPKNFGGMGLGPDKLIAYIEEFEDYGVARAADQGVIMLGPLLIQYGTPAQQQEYLPKILTNEHVWCQGYSESNAGSDLAALRTCALPDPADESMLIVNGEKIWTTLAQDATHMFALVRTDASGPRQSGISFLLLPFDAPGITVRPLLDIAGVEEFNQVHFDNVRVPRANLVGEINQGWTIAKKLLGFERIFIGSPKQSRRLLAEIVIVGEARQLFESATFAARVAELQMDVEDLAAFYGHFVDLFKRGEAIPPNISLLKIWATETYQKASRILLEVADEYAALTGGLTFGDARVDPLTQFLNAIPSTTYAGSNEIQRDIVAKQVLHLPNGK